LVSTPVPPALLKGLHAEAMLADGNELGHQEPHHSIQKSTGLDFHADEISFAFHQNVLDGCS
jgi:hypothetical protein